MEDLEAVVARVGEAIHSDFALQILDVSAGDDGDLAVRELRQPADKDYIDSSSTFKAKAFHLSSAFLVSGGIMAKAGFWARKESVPSKSRMIPSLVQVSTSFPRFCSKSSKPIFSMYCSVCL